MVKARRKEFPSFGGAIFLCNHLTRKECFDKKIFGLGPHCADIVERVKAGTTLFLYDVDQSKLHGVFEATSNGALNIIPDALISIGRRYPSQIRFKRIWFCKPLMECEFQDAIQKSFSIKNKFTYGLSHQQVAKLLHLFSSRNRLQLPQNPRLQDDILREIEISSPVKETDMQSSPNSSCGSLRSPCQTCSSSTLVEHAVLLGHKLIDPLTLVHRVQQSDISDLAKSNCLKTPLHTEEHTATFTIPGNQDAMDVQSTDDYIPLPQEEDALGGIDDLFGLLSDEDHSSGSGGGSDFEDHITVHQTHVRKEDGRYPPMVNSKLRSDSEGRKSVFSRLVRAHETFSHGKRSKTKAVPPRSVESFNTLFQKKKTWKSLHNKPLPWHNDGMLNMPSADRLSGVPAFNYSFVSGDNRRSTKLSAVKQSNVPKGCTKWIRSCDKEHGVPAMFAGVHESDQFSVKEEMRSPSSNFKRHANDSNVKLGNLDFDSEDIEEAGRKKRLATASAHQDHQSNTVSIHRGNKAMDVLATSDGNCIVKSVSLSPKDVQLTRSHLQTKVPQKDEQKQTTQGCFEHGETVTSDFSPNHGEDCEKKSPPCGNGRLVTSYHLETEMPLLQEQNPNVQSCFDVVQDEVLVPETSEVMLKFGADCEDKSSGYREEVCHLVKNGHEVVPVAAAPVHEICGPLSKFSALHGDSANKNSLLDETSGLVSSGHQDIAVLPQDEHFHSCCGDTSSVLEYSTVDTTTRDGGSGGKNAFDQKDNEALHSVTCSEDHRNTANTCSSDGIPCCFPTGDQECSKAVHETSNSVDSFVFSAEGCGSKSGISADRTSGHLAADLYGTNSESRTSFINDSSGESAETLSAAALGSENVGHNANGSEAYAEPPILQHDPGEATEQL